MSVNRLKPLPSVPPNGQLIVSDLVVEKTRQLLQSFGESHVRHEGLIYWLGRRLDQDTLVVSLLAPRSASSPQRVMASAKDIGIAAKCARRDKLSMVAQVHSHPGNDTRHSDGDDQLVLMPFEGMYSIVVAHYGKGGIGHGQGTGIHQYQAGRWVRITDDLGPGMIVVPHAVDLR